MRNTRQRRSRWFPQRELIVRANGQSRLVTLTPRIQAAGVALLACIVFAAIAALAYGSYETRAMRATLAHREARVADEQQRVSAYRDELDEATLQLERRQAFIERMIEMLPAAEEDADLAASEAFQPEGDLYRISAAMPEANGLAAIERRQLATVAALTGYAESRAARAEQAIRSLGLDPRRVFTATQRSAQSGMAGRGGPLEKLATEADGSLDPRFERMGESLARMAALEQGLARVPQVMPTALGRMTSNFGFRRDPFTGEGAMHSGLDFGGRIGDPIRAAAAGKVSFVGMRSGYGKVVEITHGNGLLTRYAHMSAWRAKPGQAVAAGEVIGAIGSTGRSTGPHLHFEVRVNDKAVNPRPLLEDAPNVLDEIRSEFFRGSSAGGA